MVDQRSPIGRHILKAVLPVDDDTPVLLGVGARLDSKGYMVYAGKDAVSAVAAVVKERRCRMIRSRRPKEALMSTALADEALMSTALADGPKIRFVTVANREGVPAARARN
jgi:hypothetical protein